VRQDSKKRLLGGFSGHISTREVRPFHHLYPSKMADVFVVSTDFAKAYAGQGLVAHPLGLNPVLEHILAAIRAVLPIVG
jgi:hypothetical protein